MNLTRSQQMALIDILIVYMQLKDEPQEFINVLTDTVTTSGDLLRTISEASTVSVAEDH